MTAYIADADLSLPASARSRSGNPLALLAAMARWVIEWPRRHAILQELRELSDRDLADIGLNRQELRRVFDADFAAARRAAGYRV